MRKSSGRSHITAATGPRPFWKGRLKLSLVTCSVVMTPATTDNNKLKFFTVNRKTGNRVVSQYIDDASGKTVNGSHQIKGFEHEPDKYVTLSDSELEAVALESTRTIEIERFAGEDEVDPLWRDKPHYLAPDDKASEEAFAVIREAMKAGKVVGIGRLVLYRRERPVLLEPRDKGIVLWTMHYADEVRDPKESFQGLSEHKRDAIATRALSAFITKNKKKWSPALLSDPVEDKLRAIVSAKKGRKANAPVESKQGRGSATNVIDITEALRRSLSAEKSRKQSDE